jgi:predicted RNA binding protein YcfA (HicA-like mRNA interferase family)
MRYRELSKRLRKLGCVPERQAKGSHYFWFNPENGKSATIPDWGGKDLRPGTVRAILRQLDISREAFGPIN